MNIMFFYDEPKIKKKLQVCFSVFFLNFKMIYKNLNFNVM